MIARRLICIFLAASILSCKFAVHAASPKSKPRPENVSFDIAAAPAWVKPFEPDTSSPTSRDIPGGVAYLLKDRQESVAPGAYYYHEVRQITSENGVQNGASVSVSFDPSYQKLAFHLLRVTRKDGSPVNRLDRAQIKLFQRERNLEEFLYDGSYTAQCELEDVRVGDVLEYAFTIFGANPVKQGKYSSFFSMQWPFPVERVVTRITYPSNRKLEFLTKNRTPKPAITEANRTTEWLCDDHDVPGRLIDQDAPTDHDPRGWVQVTEYRDWKELADWALTLFRAEKTASPEMKAEIEKLRAIENEEERVVAGLRFVQEAVRYLGIESGVGSHQPTAPSEVLRRRFGDCKDKALLLVTLLRGAGVDAAPALVSTDYRKTVADLLPSPDDFDHAIVQVRLDGKEHWLDVTRSQQRGPLDQIYVTNFGQALVLRPETTALMAYSPPNDSLPRRLIVDKYRIPPPGDAGELDVVSEYHGLAAERVRSLFQEKSREQVQKDYLQYYGRRFPSIEPRQTLTLQEMTGENGCRVMEYYRIPQIWELNASKKRYDLSFFPGDISSAMGEAGASQRDDPLALDYPVDVTETIRVEMFEDWPQQPKTTEVANEFFRYREEVGGTGRLLEFSFAYKLLADRVPVAELATYNAALTKLKDTLGYNVNYSTPAQLEETRKKGGFNWGMASLWGAFVLVATTAAIFIVRVSKRAVPLPPSPASLGLDGINGWLILVAFHQLLRPLLFLGGMPALYSFVSNLEIWRQLTDPGETNYHHLWAPALLFALFYNSMLIVFSILLLVLFFKKRAVWPAAYALFLVLLVVGTAFDGYLMSKIPAAAEGAGNGVRDLVQAIVAAVIWIPYCFVSKRVKATFRY